MKNSLSIFIMPNASTYTSINCSSPPIMPEPASNLKFEPKLAMKMTWATNEYPHLGFVPLFPRLTGMFLCLCDNPPSSKYPFSNIQWGNHYGANTQLLWDWNLLEERLVGMSIVLCVSPIPGPMLFECQYHLPSTFSYMWLHCYQGTADAILEHSRNAFYPLMATISYFLFFLNFPAIDGPLLYWEKAASSGTSSSKRLPPEMSSGLLKRPHGDPGVGHCSTGDQLIITEGKGKGREQSSGYEDSFYWQFLLACSNVPISGITEVAESELLDFSIDYPRAGYLVGDNYLSREEVCIISHCTKSILVWIIWGPKPVLWFKEFNAFFPSPEWIKEMKQCNNKGKSVDNGWNDWGEDLVVNEEVKQCNNKVESVDNGWDDWGENIVVDDEIAAPSGSSQAPPSTLQVPSSTVNVSK